MNERERNDQENPAAPVPPAGAPGNLGNIRRDGHDLLSAADDAIRRALSGDSERFLHSNRQRGGQ